MRVVFSILLAYIATLSGALNISPGWDSALVSRQNSDSQVMASFEQNGQCFYYFSTAPNWNRALQPCIAYCKNNGGHGYSECDLSPFKDVDISKIDQSLIYKDDEGNPYIPAKCKCENKDVEGLAGEIFDIVAQGLSMLDNILCAVMLEALNTILEVGIDAVPGGAVANGAKTAVQGAKSFAENGLTAASFFDNWIGDACGVPDWNFDLFGALLGAPDSMGTSIGCKRKNKADCKKVDSVPDPTKKPTQDSKPTTQDNTPPKSTLTEPTVTHPTTTGPTTLQKSTTETTATGRTTSQGTSTTASATTSGVCNLKRANNPERKGGNTIVSTECNAGATTTHAYMITSLEYAANAQPTQVTATCRNQWAQACYHYSSAISVNAQWATLTCPPAAATKSRKRLNAKATATWSSQHRGKGWQDTAHRAEPNCERDEYPPAYLLSTTDTAFVNAGKDTTGQSVRWLPASQNGAAANGMWAGQCFKTPLNGLTDQQLYDKASDPAKNFGVKPNVKSPTSTEYEVGITVESRPEFTIVAWEHGNPQSPSKDDGLSENPCWPKAIAPQDPGFTLLTFDKYYNGNKPPYDYTQPYVPGKNGVKRDLELEDYETLGREFNATFTGE